MINKKYFKIAFPIILAATMVLLARSGANIWALAWVCFVPLLWLADRLSLRETFISVTASLTLAYLGGMFWLKHLALHYVGAVFPLNYLFLLLFAVFLAIGYGLIFLCYRFITINTKIPSFIVFPLCFVVIWEFYPQLFRHSFAETQVNIPVSLQAIDITGVIGLNFILILVNGLVFEYINKSWRKNLKSYLACWLLVAIWFSYGLKNYDAWNEKITSWRKEKIAFVQPNRVASFSPSSVDQGFSIEHPWELESSIKLAQEGARFVIWPEGNSYRFNHNQAVHNNFRAVADELNVNILLAESIAQRNGDEIKYYNAIQWIKADGNLGPSYTKNILVPYGEYLPGGEIAKNITKFFGIYTPNYSVKKSIKTFNDKDIAIVPAICYESLFGRYIAKQSQIDQDGKLIIVVSQDGWYDSKAQTIEHTNITALRAVETRIPVVHIIQNGFSTITYPSGKIEYLSDYKKRSAAAFLAPLSPKENVSFYSRYPDLFYYLLEGLFLLITIFAGYNYWRKQG